MLLRRLAALFVFASLTVASPIRGWVSNTAARAETGEEKVPFIDLHCTPIGILPYPANPDIITQPPINLHCTPIHVSGPIIPPVIDYPVPTAKRDFGGIYLDSRQDDPAPSPSPSTVPIPTITNPTNWLAGLDPYLADPIVGPLLNVFLPYLPLIDYVLPTIIGVANSKISFDAIRSGATSIEDVAKATGLPVENIRKTFALLPKGTIPGI